MTMTAIAQRCVAQLVDDDPRRSCAVGDHRVNKDMRGSVVGGFTGVAYAGRGPARRSSHRHIDPGRQRCFGAVEIRATAVDDVTDPRLTRPAEDGLALDGAERSDGETGDEGSNGHETPAVAISLPCAVVPIAGRAFSGCAPGYLRANAPNVFLIY